MNLETHQPWVTSFLIRRQINILRCRQNTHFGDYTFRLLKFITQKNNNQVDSMELGAQIHMSIFIAKTCIWHSKKSYILNQLHFI